MRSAASDTVWHLARTRSPTCCFHLYLLFFPLLFRFSAFSFILTYDFRTFSCRLLAGDFCSDPFLRNSSNRSGLGLSNVSSTGLQTVESDKIPLSQPSTCDNSSGHIYVLLCSRYGRTYQFLSYALRLGWLVGEVWARTWHLYSFQLLCFFHFLLANWVPLSLKMQLGRVTFTTLLRQALVVAAFIGSFIH